MSPQHPPSSTATSAELALAPVLGRDGRILEGVVTTLDADQSVHVAPMGPIVDDRMERLWLRPFRTSTTFQNIKRTGAGVFHVTDDVELIARAAIGQLQVVPRVLPAEKFPGAVLADACRWYAFDVESLDDSAERTSLVARIVDQGVQREFLGFNRGKNAVIEAAILATRVHLLDAEQLLAEFDRLAAPVVKTGAAEEHRAFNLLRDYVHQRLASAYAS